MAGVLSDGASTFGKPKELTEAEKKHKSKGL